MSADSNDKIKGLFNWCVQQTKGYKDVDIRNFTSSWKDGLGFCAILHRYGPEFIDFNNLSSGNIYENCDLAFNVAEKHFGIPSLLCPKDMVIMKSPDRLCIITYLSQYYNSLATRKPKLRSEEHGLLSSIENVPNEIKAKEETNTGEEGIENQPSVIEERSENQKCAICSETIYLLEKLNVGDVFYHRSCYRQNQLMNLKIRNRTLERPKPHVGQINENNTNESNEMSVSTEKPQSNLSSPSKSPVNSRKEILSPTLDISSSENNFLDNCRYKSVRNSEDHSSQSASSINFISVNASSVESLSQNASDLPLKIDKSENTFSNQLRPSSLDNSMSSLNSSFSKKRPAPPPPISLKPKYDLTKKTLSKKASSNSHKSRQYPEDLNPFASNDDVSSTQTKTSKRESSTLNPFEEFMSNENLHIDEKAEKKSNKRPAPRLPRKFSSDSGRTTESVIRADVPGTKIVNSSCVPPSNVHIEHKPDTDMTSTGFSEPNDIDQNVDQNKKTSNMSSPSKFNTSPVPLTRMRNNASEIKADNNLSSTENIVNNSTLSSPEKSIDSSKPINNNPGKPSLSKLINNFDKISVTSDNQKGDLKPEKKSILKKMDSKSKSQEELNQSKPSVHKAPAPARPPPPKREVRGDTSYEFIPYDSLYSQLKELNEKQSQIEAEGRKLQNILWESDQKVGNFEELLQNWLDLVKMKNDLYAKEKNLHDILRRQELEDRHSDLEYELRLLMGKQESQKTAAEKAREEELITQILDTVNARAQLVEQVDDEQARKSSTNETHRSKSTIKNLFSIKRRSSSVGKVHSKPFKFGRKKKQTDTFIIH